jgi:sugar-specific transcriptional regulator TrmB
VVTLQELAERVEKLEREVAELKMRVKPRPQPKEITPEELERRREAVKALLEFAERLRGRGVTLTDILMEMRYGSGKWCD